MLTMNTPAAVAGTRAFAIVEAATFRSAADLRSAARS